MASGAASGGASQPATAASATGGYSEAPSAAPLAEVAEERRRALDGELYTMEEFRHSYQKPYGSFSTWRRYGDRAVQEAVPLGASLHGSSERVGRSSLGSAALAAEPAAAPAALSASPIGGSSQAPSDAPLVEDAQERR